MQPSTNASTTEPGTAAPQSAHAKGGSVVAKALRASPESNVIVEARKKSRGDTPMAAPAVSTEGITAMTSVTAPLPPPAALRQAAENADLSALKTLLDDEIDVDSRDADGRTALMLATLRGQTDAVELLLAHGADPNAADSHGTTPLQAAIAGGQKDITKALKRAGAQ